MANNIHTATADESKLLELQVLPADDFTDPASVRTFVGSEEFGNYAWLVYRVLYPEARLSPLEDHLARCEAGDIVRDLVELAQIAAGPDCPLTVTQDPCRDSAEVVRRLGMVGRAITLCEGWESPPELQRPLFKLVDYHQRLVDAGERGWGMSTVSH